MEDAIDVVVDADNDETTRKIAKRPRKKKSVEKQAIVKKAIAERGPARMSPDRTYMIQPDSKTEEDIVVTTLVMRTSMRPEQRIMIGLLHRLSKGDRYRIQRKRKQTYVAINPFPPRIIRPMTKV